MATMTMYLSCSIALITNYMHAIEQTTIGARELQVKAVGAVRKQQHIVYQVSARSTMR